MGFTRARRYANHPSGKKYNETGDKLPQAKDWDTSIKAQSAKIFYEYYELVKNDQVYIAAKAKHSSRK
jgi:hypothetical protein